MSLVKTDLGAVTNYAYAVEHGYFEGTEEEYNLMMTQTAQNAQICSTSAESASEDAETATLKAAEAVAAAASASAAYGTDLLADDFTTTKPYEVGEHVIYNGDLWVFDDAHEAGEWLGTDAHEVQVGPELADLKSAISVLEPAVTAEDVGKALIAKTVGGGKVTEYEFGETSEIDDTAGEGDTDKTWSADKLAGIVESIVPGLSNNARIALLNCFAHVAWADEHGQDYYDNLQDALTSVPLSITATFIQGSAVVYNTDSLDSLRQYLTVVAQYADGTTKIINNYLLYGVLSVGDSTITAEYNGKTDTFIVNVTQSQAYITADYTSGSETIYTDTPLNNLKTNLVVTYYESQETEGVVLQDNQYELSGELSAGTNAVSVIYEALTTTFIVNQVVDFYNQWNVSLAMPAFDLFVGAGQGSQGSEFVVNDSANLRKRFSANRGLVTFTHSASGSFAPEYPIPVPPDAQKVTVSVTPQTQYCNIVVMKLINGQYIVEKNMTWYEGQAVQTFTPSENRFIAVVLKYDQAGTSYPTPPSAITAVFE